jgi:predicted TIM-barrel fold metal-dependent hydrolase
MKNITRILVAVIFLSLAVSAGEKNREYKKEYLQRAEQNSLVTLDGDMNSLVESAIYNMILFKSNVPNWKFDEILDKLNELSIDGKTASIRYKAQLASLYINYPELFVGVNAEGGTNASEVFKEIANKIETKLIAVN